MNQLQNFHFENHEVRTVLINNVPYFVGKDLTEVLGYQNSSKAIQDHVDSEDKLNNNSLSSLGQRGGWLINESGLYSLILKSKLPSSKKFKRWVTSEVLPSIRKTGGYSNVPRSFAEALRLAADIEEQNNQLKLENSQLKPKALFADAVSASHTSILVGELAKILKQNGVEMGATRLFEWLRKHGYLIKRKGAGYNMPTQKSMELGLFEIKETSIARSDGSVSISKTSKVTGFGQQYFVNKFLSKKAGV